MTSFKAVGLEARKFDGAKASVSIRMKNSTRRFSSGSTPSTSDTMSFRKFAVSR